MNQITLLLNELISTPIEVELQVQELVSRRDLVISEDNDAPMIVEMQVEQNDLRYITELVETNLVYDMDISQYVIATHIPHNYGLITWNGSYLTVS